MKRVLVISFLIALFFSSCGSSSTTITFLNQDAATTIEIEEASSEIVTSDVSNKYKIKCARTNATPSGYVQSGNEGIGCVVVDAEDEAKVTELLGNFILQLTFSDETTALPIGVFVDSSSNWHYVFQLESGKWDNLTAFVASVVIEGARIEKSESDPDSYNPENL